MLNDNKEIARRFLEMIWNEGALEEAIRRYRPSARSHDLGADVLATDEYARFVTMTRTLLTEAHMAIEHVVGEGDLVVVHGRLTGTLRTGKPIAITGFSLVRLEARKIVEAWNVWDALGLHAQIEGRGPRTFVDVVQSATK